jgi:hypothetical protein
VQLLWDRWQWRCGAEPNDRAEFVGSLADEVAVEAQHLLRFRGIPHYGTSQDRGSYGVQVELESCDNSKISAPASQRPKQVCVLILRCTQLISIGSDDID